MSSSTEIVPNSHSHPEAANTANTVNSDWLENHPYDELQLGQSARLVRTLTQADIAAFAALSGDVNPAHLDPDYAEGTFLHGVVAHGLWSAGLISALLGTQFPGPGTIYLSQTLNFTAPVRIGDTLAVRVTVLEKRSHHNVLLGCEVNNQRGEGVLRGEALVKAPDRKIRLPRPTLPRMQIFDPDARLHAFLAPLASLPSVRCAVVHPCDMESLRGAVEAAELGLIIPVLIAPRARLEALAAEGGLDLTGLQIEDVAHSHAAAQRGVAMAAAGEVAALMKGSLHTDELMHEVIHCAALRTKRRMSHVFHIDAPLHDRPLLITDAALNIRPDLAAKADIVANAIELAHAMGWACPKVALLSAVETINEKMISTLDAAALCKMADRGQITGAILDGPLAFDNAVSLEAAQRKGIRSDVAGQADILVVPDLESGNMLAKQLEYLGGASTAGIVLGAKVPIALTSRADGAAARKASAGLVKILAHWFLTHQP
ncbi:bifunctional enoyl-CoA hydratase/phosphate acetyltransferase [Leptothrix ochracea]|uniref:bifunctional enoyl-CoA hydratase/phosphate acetyltransferase n=1 Tax=Leptothrix ochracea TaxID=735331 RepID=UPI0034E1AA3A